VPVEEARRLFDVNYWGMVHGVTDGGRASQGSRGALINVRQCHERSRDSAQGHYSASKHAVKAFTDALRMEIEKEEAPIS
jgi:NAD(P)-dependent dehydrogenase (short-subunit alcohol dehydrogenase family)